MTPTVRRILLSQSLEKKVQSIVRRNGIAMYVPVPGVTCFQDSACTIPAAVDDPVGGLKDYLGLYPATQATSGYRPILRGKVKNWVKYSKDFSNASWTKRGSAVVNPVPVTGPFGDLDGWEISGLKLNGNNDIYKFIDTIAPSTTIAPSCYIQKTTYEGIIRLQNPSSSALGDWTIDLSLLSSDWERISVTHPAVTVVSAFISDSSGNSGFYLKGGSDVTEAAFRISAAQIELGSVANPYVPTTSAPASSSYGPYWLDFDGVNDVLSISGLSAFTSAAVIKSVKNTGYSIQTEQDISAGYSFNTKFSNALMLAKSTPSSSELAVIKKYFDRLAGVA